MVNYWKVPGPKSWFLSYLGLKSSLAISENNKKIKSCGGPDRTGPVRPRAMTALPLSRKGYFVLLVGTKSSFYCSLLNIFLKKYKIQRKNRK